MIDNNVTKAKGIIKNNSESPPTISELFHKSKLRITDEIKIPPVCLTIETNDRPVVVSTLGNISMIIGIAKSRKTYLLSSIASAFIKQSTILKFCGTLPANKNLVLYVDTEQGPFHARKVQKRIFKMAGLPETEEPNNFEFLMLRPYSPQQCCDIIQHAVYTYDNLGVVIIDGLRDLLKDINSSEESAKIARLLMKWSFDRDIHIMTVLHENKGDRNPRGHIGTEFSNKAESIIRVEKDETNKDISIVSSHLLRDQDFEKFAFEIGNNDVPSITDFSRFTKGSKTAPSTHDLQFHKNLLSLIFLSAEEDFSSNQLNQHLKLKLPENFKLSEKPLREWINYYDEQKLIINMGNDTRSRWKKNF